VNLYARVSLGKDSSGRACVINRRTKAMLDEAVRILDRPLTVVQGSYRNGSGAVASAGTHDGGGVIDLRTWDLPAKGLSVLEVLTALRRVGFAAWYRSKAQGFDPHIHAVAIGDRHLHPSAAAQVEQYRRGLNGLANQGRDDGPQVRVRTWEKYQEEKLPSVSVGYMRQAWTNDRHRKTGLYPIQTRRVQKALGFTLRTGRWGRPTRARFGANGPTEATLRALGRGKFRVVE